MKLRALRLHNVKRFAGHGVAIENIGDGVNVLTAANEVGKSTCFEALHALFFQAHSGTPNSVQMLRPYSGGNPLVEADIETEEGRFRLTKQFYGGRSARITDLANGRLLAQADEAERFIAELTRGGAGGPAGLLWVRQGLTGLEKRTKTEEESDRRIRETLLSSVQGEVEALTGGRRMLEISASCETALARLVTATLRPKTGGPYAEALEERDRLTLLEQQLSSEVTELRHALDRRRSVARRLAELEAPQEVEARKTAIAAAEEAYQSARSHAETLRAAEASLALASERHRAATTDLERFETALRRAMQVEAQSATTRIRLEQVQARHEQAIAERDRLEADVQSAEQAERQARQDKDNTEAAQRARDAALRFDAAREHLQQAETLRANIESGLAKLAALAIPENAITQLEAFDIELARLEGARLAALPVLRMHYSDPDRSDVLMAGEPLSHDQDQTFTGTVALDIAAIGRLTIRSQYADDNRQAIAAVEQKARDLRLQIGVGSLAEARARLSTLRETSDRLALDRQLFDQLAPDGIEMLREAVSRLEAIRSHGLEFKFDPQAVESALRSAEARVADSRNAVREARAGVELAYKELVVIHAEEAALLAEVKALAEILGHAEQRETARVRMSTRVEQCLGEMQAAAAIAEPLRTRAGDMAAAEISLTRLRAVASAAQQEAQLNKETLADLNGQIRTQADKAIEEIWQETQEALRAASAQVARYEREVKTLDRLRKALASARSSARDLYLRPVLSELRPLIGLLFDDVSVVFNEDTLLPETLSRNGQAEDVERLSGGMREQLSILTRLAFARLLAQDGRSAPVILDDALVYSDDERIERMFEALHRQARGQQLIVFSCRQRAFSQLGGNVLNMTDWTPS